MTADNRLIPAGPGDFELICAGGALGKCVRFGYHPWETTSVGRSVRDYYDACARMVRADYCGNGHSWTRTGMLIGMWDDLGIQVSQSPDYASFSFEAGWTPAGAVCVAHTRVPHATRRARAARAHSSITARIDARCLERECL
jgi:hypothetical protein